MHPLFLYATLASNQHHGLRAPFCRTCRCRPRAFAPPPYLAPPRTTRLRRLLCLPPWKHRPPRSRCPARPRLRQACPSSPPETFERGAGRASSLRLSPLRRWPRPPLPPPCAVSAPPSSASSRVQISPTRGCVGTAAAQETHCGDKNNACALVLHLQAISTLSIPI